MTRAVPTPAQLRWLAQTKPGARKRKVDPSGTASIVAQYETAARRRFRAVRHVLSVAVADRDVLGLAGGLRVAIDDPPPTAPGHKQFASGDSSQRIDAFMTWLKSLLNDHIVTGREGVLPPSPGGWQRQFIRHAYTRGHLSAQTQIARGGVRSNSVKGRPATRIDTSLLNSKFAKSRLAALYSRNLAELKGVTTAMASQIERILADSFLQGDGPREAARDIVKAVDSIGIKRAELIARTETIRASAEAQLDSFEELGGADFGGVQLDAEIVTAGDDRTCEECEDLTGEVFSIEDARGMIPVHPNCRCSWIAVYK